MFCMPPGVCHHYCDVIMGANASQITSLTIVYSTVNSGADQRKHQSFASLAFVRGIPWWPVNWPVTRKMFQFDDGIVMVSIGLWSNSGCLFTIIWSPFWCLHAHILCYRLHVPLCVTWLRESSSLLRWWLLSNGINGVIRMYECYHDTLLCCKCCDMCAYI